MRAWRQSFFLRLLQPIDVIANVNSTTTHIIYIDDDSDDEIIVEMIEPAPKRQKFDHESATSVTAAAIAVEEKTPVSPVLDLAQL